MRKGVQRYGYACVSADYRLAPQVGVAEILDDVKDCVAYIQNELASELDHDAVDVSRIAVSGSSAGGYLALLAGLYIPEIRCLAPIYPITDRECCTMDECTK
jgi:acetyl esterase/lipase